MLTDELHKPNTLFIRTGTCLSPQGVTYSTRILSAANSYYPSSSSRIHNGRYLCNLSLKVSSRVVCTSADFICVLGCGSICFFSCFFHFFYICLFFFRLFSLVCLFVYSLMGGVDGNDFCSECICS